MTAIPHESAPEPWDEGDEPEYGVRHADGTWRDGHASQSLTEGECLYVRADLPRPGTRADDLLAAVEAERDALKAEVEAARSIQPPSMAEVAALRQSTQIAQSAQRVAERRLEEVRAIVKKAPDEFAARYKPLHNRKRVDTDYVDRAVRKALAIMAEDIVAALSPSPAAREQEAEHDTHA